MKFVFLLTAILLFSISANAEDSSKNSNKHFNKYPDTHLIINSDIANTSQCENTLELTPQSISSYRRLGCIFANEFYSDGSVLNLNGTKSQCHYNNGSYQWKILNSK